MNLLWKNPLIHSNSLPPILPDHQARQLKGVFPDWNPCTNALGKTPGLTDLIEEARLQPEGG
jgi:hypothetical protein